MTMEGGGDDGQDDLDDGFSALFPPHDEDSRTVAEVSQYSFLDHLRHYMDGNRISYSNRKAVAWTILFEVGTLKRNLDTLRTRYSVSM